MRIYITDVTLRDGDHAMGHQFTLAHIAEIARGLDEAGVDVIECSHGDGLAGSSIQYGMSREQEEDILRTAAATIKRAQLAVLLLPGIATKSDLKMAAQMGVKVARVATHCTEADISEQHIGLAKSLGMRVVGFLMMAHMISAQKLAEQAKLMESYGADCVYVVDSAGGMTTLDARERVRALRQALRCEIGFHAHNNLALAVGNSVAAIEEGATCIDASTCGLGAGAGNTQTEVLAAVLSRLGYETGIDLYRLMDVAEESVKPIMLRPQIIDRDSLTIGYAGVYSTFLLHAKRIAKQFGVDSRSLLAELGRRKMVGGQEDMILDVAVEMAQAKQAGTTARPVA
ncbi:MAG: 4-hydroxy-2-oxovalerate aldolase [Candidatus Binatia bacterium]